MQTLVDDHYQTVLDQYGYMNDDDFNDQLDNMAFDEDQPLIDFETTNGWSSYRAHWRQIEDDWLANGADLNNDPTEGNMVEDPVLAALLSEEGMVEVGGVLLYVNPSGQWFSITPWHCEDAEALVNGTYTGPIHKKVVGYESNCGSCLGAKLDNNNYEPWNNRKVKWRHEHAYDPAHAYVGIRAVQKCYRKRFGFWRRWRTNQDIHLEGDFTDSNTGLNPPCPRFGYTADRAARYWRLVLFATTVPDGTSMDYCMPDCSPHAEFSLQGSSYVSVQLCL